MCYLVHLSFENGSDTLILKNQKDEIRTKTPEMKWVEFFDPLWYHRNIAGWSPSESGPTHFRQKTHQKPSVQFCILANITINIAGWSLSLIRHTHFRQKTHLKEVGGILRLLLKQKLIWNTEWDWKLIRYTEWDWKARNEVDCVLQSTLISP